MKKFPIFDTLIISKNLGDVFLESFIDKDSELMSIFGENSGFKMITEESLPENHILFIQKGIIVAIYKNGRIFVVPEDSILKQEKIREKILDIKF